VGPGDGDAVEGGDGVGREAAVVDPDLLLDAAHVRFEVEAGTGTAGIAGSVRAWFYGYNAN